MIAGNRHVRGPAIVTAILEGRQPLHLTAKRLAAQSGLAPDWSRQPAQLNIS